jgi:5-methyltetrahydropteroyltriglutamate--homocysteine methyltransferase
MTTAGRDRSVERILTTHTGSLPRSPGLGELLKRADAGEQIDDLGNRVAEGVTDSVRQQVEAGILVVNDGEASKLGYSTYVKERMDGFGGQGDYPGEPEEARDFPEFMADAFSGEGLDFDMPACVGPVRYRDLDAVSADIANLKTALAGLDVADVFMTAASPGVIAFFLQNQHYDTHEEYIGALADAMKHEYDAIHAAGFVLQLDCPDLAMGRHAGDFGRMAPVHIEAINHATRDIPPDRLRMHVCWGNYEGPHHTDVPISEIIDLVLGARPAGLLVEAANPRHAHEWRVFEDVRLPAGKVIVPGVIDTTTNYIEHPQLVADRIIQYARVVGRENVIAGTDCGFATFANFLPVHPAIVWAKLRALSDGAELATRELFGRSPAA